MSGFPTRMSDQGHTSFLGIMSSSDHDCCYNGVQSWRIAKSGRRATIANHPTSNNDFSFVVQQQWRSIQASSVPYPERDLEGLRVILCVIAALRSPFVLTLDRLRCPGLLGDVLNWTIIHASTGLLPNDLSLSRHQILDGTSRWLGESDWC